jgi:uncharacterized Zn-binding protein involved in type VI secretion
MPKNAARMGDEVGHAGGGTILEGSPDTTLQGKRAARAHRDHAKCEKNHPPRLLVQGSATVTVNGKPLARLGDATECGAKVLAAAATVLVGG